MKVTGSNKIIVDDHGTRSLATSWGAVRQDLDGSVVAFLSTPPARARERAVARTLQIRTLNNGIDLSKGVGLIASAFVVVLIIKFGPPTEYWIANLLVVLVAGILAWQVGKRIGAAEASRQEKLVTVVEADSGSVMEMILEGCFDDTIQPIAEAAALWLIRHPPPEPEDFTALITDLFAAWQRSEALPRDLGDDARAELLMLASNLPIGEEARSEFHDTLIQFTDNIEAAAQTQTELDAAVEEPIVRAALQQQHEDDQVETVRAKANTHRLRIISHQIQEGVHVSKDVIDQMRSGDAEQDEHSSSEEQ